jgi:3-deoxy-manno-octulosonate cytidylyltransferase (CMP-KDO synthetase)
MKDFVIIIPARYDSKRLLGKPLIDILGKTMIQRVYEQCLKAVPASLIYIATDDIRIRDVSESFGANVLMTSKECLTGTDRVAEAASQINARYYINLQGDEPIFNPEDITKLISNLNSFDGEILNGYCSIKTEKQFINKSIPKVVFRPDKRLLYMSRSPIPGNKTKDFIYGHRQVCIYAFPKVALTKFTDLNYKTPLEDIEDIEILRFLELGFEVRMIKLSDQSLAVDHIEDVVKVVKKLKDEYK